MSKNTPYNTLEEVILGYGGVPVEPMEVYSDMYHFEDHYLQNENEEPGLYKANPLVYYKNKDESSGHYRILFQDTFEESLAIAQDADFAITNGITYFGRKNVQSHASKMFAMIFDLDGLTPFNLHNFFYAAYSEFHHYPIPNYIVTSGHNAHLYYIFEEPIDLYPNIKTQLKEFKYQLTRKLWNHYTSEIDKPQYQGINQGFRVIGGKTKIPGKRTQAYRLNTHPTEIHELNQYVEMEFDKDALFKSTNGKLTLEQAKKKYPDWYKRVVLDGKKGFDAVKKWDIAGKVHGDNPHALYDWWMRTMTVGATEGHRYFCIMVLAICAVKCEYPYEKLEKDALDLVPFLNAKGVEPFTEQDVYSALECYDDRYCTFPREDMEKITQIEIKPNKRNNKDQKTHLKIARFTRDLNYDEPNGWANKDGAPTKEELIHNYLDKHPDANNSEIEKATGITRKTVRKWRKTWKTPGK